MASAGLTAWSLAFQKCPIILQGGVASSIPGGMLPLIAITESLSFATGLLSGAAIDLDNFFANFQPIPGGSIISQRIAHRPFANNQVAGDSTIQQPLRFSMLMICPAKGELGMVLKLATIMSLQAVIQNHNQQGGTYVVLEPSYVYTSALMLDMRDAPIASTRQPQTAWQLDFEQPLLTLAQSQTALGSIASAISSGVQTLFGGIGSAVGQTISTALSAIIPSSTASGSAALTSGFTPSTATAPTGTS